MYDVLLSTKGFPLSNMAHVASRSCTHKLAKKYFLFRTVAFLWAPFSASLYEVAKSALFAVDSINVYRKDSKPEVTCVILCLRERNLRSFLLSKFEFTQK